MPPTLKHGDTFALFDGWGDVDAGRDRSEGIFVPLLPFMTTGHRT